MAVYSNYSELAFGIAVAFSSREWSIYEDIDAPHIVGYFACESGEIELEALFQ